MCAHLQRGERAERGSEEEVSWRREGGECCEVNEVQRCGLTRVRVRTSGLNSVEKVIC